MKSYFILKNKTLIEKLKEYESMKNKVNETFAEFSKEYGIETTGYYQTTTELKIVPTVKDCQKFRDQLKADCETFKKKSVMNKAWVKLCEIRELRTPHKPVFELASLIDNGIYRFKSSLFSLGNDVYGSFEADICFNLPSEDFEELKASEFYKAIEEYEQKTKEV